MRAMRLLTASALALLLGVLAVEAWTVRMLATGLALLALLACGSGAFLRNVNWGCLLVLAAALIIDALAVWAAVSLARLLIGV